MSEPKTVTTIQVSLVLDGRVKKLAQVRSEKMGLSKPLSKNTYLEMLVTEEEDRVKSEAN